MKGNIKFFATVLCLLLLSSILLTGEFSIVSAITGEAKAYDLDVMPAVLPENGTVISDAPTPQSEMQKNFSEMCEIDGASNTVTVISRDYLRKYWQDNYEKEVIHSLTKEEIFFIIQDSIDLYTKYDKIILPAFASTDPKLAERFPNLEERTVYTNGGDFFSLYDENHENIYAIIMYRLTALSSPKAFYTGAEAISFAGGNPDSRGSMYSESVFYIPGYSENTDRDFILTVMGTDEEFTEYGNFNDVLAVSASGAPVIELTSRLACQVTMLFPTQEMINGIGNMGEAAEGIEIEAPATEEPVTDESVEAFATDESVTEEFTVSEPEIENPVPTEGFKDSDPTSWFVEDSARLVDDSEIEQLKVGMTLREMIGTIGYPQRDIGSGIIIAEWDTVSGKVLDVAFNLDPDLTSADGKLSDTWVSFNIEIKDK